MQGWGRGEKSLHGRGSSPEGLGKEFGMWGGQKEGQCGLRWNWVVGVEGFDPEAT